MTKVWAFYRRSTDRQEMSIEDQRKECQRFAASRGWEIVQEFTPEKGYASGLTVDRDPAFQRMLRAAETRQHGASHLLVYDVSRFGRLRPEDKIYWEQRFRRDGGLQVIYAKDDFKNDGSLSDVVTKLVKHSEAHEFSQKLSQLTLRGSKTHAGIGNSAGGRPPYGYGRQLLDINGSPVSILSSGLHKADKTQRVRWTPSPEEASVVREIFRRADLGQGLNTIVKWLNGDRIPSPTGKFWTKGQIHYLLRNVAYVGRRVYNKRSYKAYRRGEKGTLQNPREEWVICENAHPAILDRNLFDRVQSRLGRRTIGQGRSYHFPHLLAGLIFCRRCGYRFNGLTKRSTKGHSHRYYVCGGYMRVGTSICRSVHVLADDMEQLALDSVKAMIHTPGLRDEIKPLVRALLEAEHGAGLEVTREDLQKRLDSLTVQLNNLVQAVKSGVHSQALLQELARVEEEKKNVAREIDLAAQRQSPTSDLESLLDEAMGYLNDFDSLWKEEATVEEKKEVLRAYIHRVEVDHSPERIEATYQLFRLPQPPKNRPARAAIAGNPGTGVNHHLSLLRG